MKWGKIISFCGNE